ncbi:MAG TPA: ATP-dependent helicase HrpB [Myxococcaceae bacterium]|nr:ATP-dependent helicase HrpB [Myxococcaceae bacterium]
MTTTALPIDPLLPEIIGTLKDHPSLVLVAAPGAGKTTRVPRAILESGLAGGKEVVVLQPRRLPTRLAASRVAEELGENVGERVGYQVRFDEVRGPKTRLSFVTEGILTRKLLAQPTLPDCGVVVLDEFHERHLQGDLALAQLRQLQRGARPDLKIVVMSATLEAEPIAAYLGGAPLLRSEGRRFPVSEQFLEQPDERRIEEQVLSGLKRLVQQAVPGDILVFLPGAGEIRRSMALCADYAERHGFDLLPLHGELPPAEQDRAVRPGPRRKIILSTNVAETSVTIEGVGAVLDTGLARVATHSPWSGMPALRVAKISRASAIQRAGRAGRTREGHCLRLYTRHDFDGRPEHDVPEIRRLDLTEAVLALYAQGVTDPAAFPFFEAPPEASVHAAITLLRDLGAVDEGGRLTPIGQRLMRMPLHPRLARVLDACAEHGVGDEGATVVALLGERDLRLETRARFDTGPRGATRATRESGPSDVLALLERYRQAEAAHFQAGRLRSMQIDVATAQTVSRVKQRLTRGLERKVSRPSTPELVEQALMLGLLAGFPDRVARRRKAHAPEVLLVGGTPGTLEPSSVVHEAPLLIAVDAEERQGTRGVRIRLASEIEAEWLLELFPDALEELDTLTWNASTQRVERLRQVMYRGLVLEEQRSVAPAGPEAGRVLAEAAVAAGIERFVDPEALEQWRMRVELLAEAHPELNFPSLDAGFFAEALAELSELGARNFEELRELDVLGALRNRLTSEQSRLLSSQVPDRVQLPGGRNLQIHYEPGKPPWIASRLQDFFGMAKTPTIANGRIPLVLHLLAPNMRAVQVTTDLAGFWERHYPSLRKELGRKYPRHSWPEDPLTASPPAPRPPRPRR